MRNHPKLKRKSVWRHLGTKFDAKLAQVGTKIAKVGAKVGQVHPKMAQDGTQDGPKKPSWTLLGPLTSSNLRTAHRAGAVGRGRGGVKPLPRKGGRGFCG